MSPAFHDPPAAAAEARLVSARRATPVDVERRTVARRPAVAPVELIRARRTVGPDDAEAEAPVAVADSCRRAACTPAKAADHPIGRSDAATARRVTGATAAPGRGRAARNDGPADARPDEDPDVDVDDPDAGVAPRADRRSVAEAAAPAVAAAAPIGAVFMAERVRRANSFALLVSAAEMVLRSALAPAASTERRTVVVAGELDVERPPSVAQELSWTRPADDLRSGIPEWAAGERRTDPRDVPSAVEAATAGRADDNCAAASAAGEATDCTAHRVSARRGAAVAGWAPRRSPSTERSSVDPGVREVSSTDGRVSPGSASAMLCEPR